jgi:hypothetical protein
MKHRSPAQSCLEAIEDHEFKKFTVIMQRYTPLVVVIGDHQRIITWPGAAGNRFHDT